MGWRSQPPPPTLCQDNKAPKSSLPLPLPPSFIHALLSSTSLFLGHDCGGVVGFSCQQRYPTAKKEKAKAAQGTKGITSLQTGGILSQQRDITLHKLHTLLISPSLPDELYITREAGGAPEVAFIMQPFWARSDY